jgi:hypothetical protein
MVDVMDVVSKGAVEVDVAATHVDQLAGRAAGARAEQESES